MLAETKQISIGQSKELLETLPEEQAPSVSELLNRKLLEMSWASTSWSTRSEKLVGGGFGETEVES